MDQNEINHTQAEMQKIKILLEGFRNEILTAYPIVHPIGGFSYLFVRLIKLTQ